MKPTHPYGGGLSPSVNLISNVAGLKPSRTEGVYLPPPATALINKAAGLKPSRTEGVYLSTSSNGINEQSGWTEAQPYGGGLSPYVQQRN